MKRSVRIASHLAAAGVGFAIATTGWLPHHEKADTAAQKTEVAPPTKSPPTTARPRKEAKATLGTRDFQKAWDAVASRNLKWRDRSTLQQQILAKWAQVDLEAALSAALKESWEPGGGNVGGTYYFENPLLAGFSQAFSDRPLDAWALIQSGKYGLATQLLRDQWLTAVSKSDPSLVASLLNELPASRQSQAIAGIVASAANDADREKILAQIIAQAGAVHDDWIGEALKQLPSGGNPEELRNRWTALPDGDSRKIALARWAASLRKLDPEKLSSELANLPADTRTEATRTMLSQFTAECPGLLTALDSAISAGQLDAVSKTGPALIANFAEGNLVPPAQLAEWACNLPEGPETTEMFYKAVGRYIREDLPRAQEWLDAMPEGSWQRENGLAEFSQQALWRKSDPASSQWALDAITDPKIKANAEKWRNDWERQTGFQSK